LPNGGGSAGAAVGISGVIIFDNENGVSSSVHFDNDTDGQPPLVVVFDN
jgi:hypothetical protein